jgi:hypothetical protein
VRSLQFRPLNRKFQCVDPSRVPQLATDQKHRFHAVRPVIAEFAVDLLLSVISKAEEQFTGPHTRADLSITRLKPTRLVINETRTSIQALPAQLEGTNQRRRQHRDHDSIRDADHCTPLLRASSS